MTKSLCPQKPGKVLDKWLRSTIDKGHEYRKMYGRQFPGIQFAPSGPWPMVETIDDDGTVNITYQGNPYFSKLQIDAYVNEFCKLNHLKGA